MVGLRFSISRLSAALALVLACGGGGDGDTDTDTDTDTASTFSTTSSSSSGSSPDTFSTSTPEDEDDSDTFSTSTTTSTSTSTTTSSTTSTTQPDTDTDTDTDPSDTDATDTDSTTATASDSASESESESDTNGVDGGDCCDARPDETGCEIDDVQMCVCDEDPYCCEMAWDDACTVSVVIHGCADCTGIGGGGDCCQTNDSPGCADNAIEACVCGADFVCCLEAWDETCVAGVEAERCGTCN